MFEHSERYNLRDSLIYSEVQYLQSQFRKLDERYSANQVSAVEGSQKQSKRNSKRRNSNESSKKAEPRDKRLAKLLQAAEVADFNSVFAEPVTDDIAPDYSSTISNPMDLSTAR